LLRHSVFTLPQAGVCRKLTDRWDRTNAKCSVVLIGQTVRGPPEALAPEYLRGSAAACTGSL
jgi:hypothetical protein